MRARPAGLRAIPRSEPLPTRVAQRVSEADFDRCFAVARLTPGTNLLALYTPLGSRIASWRGAAVALAISTILPALIATVLAALYPRYSHEPLVAKAMSGAKAGALAVFLWAVIRLSRPIIIAQTGRASLLLAGALTVTLTGTSGPCRYSC